MPRHCPLPSPRSNVTARATTARSTTARSTAWSIVVLLLTLLPAAACRDTPLEPAGVEQPHFTPYASIVAGPSSMLGHLGGGGTIAAALNEAGDVTGWSRLATSQTVAFHWSETAGMVAIAPPAWTGSVAGRAINDAGHIVGNMFLLFQPSRAFRWTPELGVLNLGVLGPEASTLYSRARAINASGVIAGDGTSAFAPGQRAWRWTEAGGMEDLGAIPGMTAAEPTAINDAGVIVGMAFNGASWRAFRWSATDGMQELGGCPPPSTQRATAVNAAGMVVGYCSSASQFTAWRWTAASGMETLAGFPGGGNAEATGINDAGYIVGTAYSPAHGQWRAALWTPENVIHDITTAVNDTYAGAINNALQVITTDRRVQLVLPSPNQAPMATVGGPYTGSEGASVALALGGSDPDAADVLSFAWDLGDGTIGSGATPPASHTYAENGTYSITLTVTDAAGLTHTATTTATVANVTPTIGAITTPLDPIALSAAGAVPVTASFTDAGLLDTHTATVACGNGAMGTTVTAALTPGSTLGQVSGRCAYAAPGVYQVTVTVTDSDLGQGSLVASSYVVVYDPTAGFVTGGGWIAYDAAACPVLCGGAVGRGDFGLVAKYQKGATVPSGDTQFDFHAGALTFRSTSYAWLVVAGTRAQLKGEGTINGVAGYQILLTLVDGTPDRFRIKITRSGESAPVFDNQMGLDDSQPPTALDKVTGNGAIVIHTPKK